MHPAPHARILSLWLLLASMTALSAQAQVPERQIRAYIPPDQLVSFVPTTTFDRFIEFLNPIFERVTGKQAIDPDTRTAAIGITISSMHFLDAFELVLQYHGLTYRETPQFFIVEQAELGEGALARTAADEGAAGALNALMDAEGNPMLPPAFGGTREIQINAVLFELNLTKAREVGLDWSVFLGGGEGGAAGGGDAGGAGGEEGGTSFFLKTDEVFSGLDDIIVAPDKINFSDLASFFRLLETEGIGETVANPQVTVQSGQQGRIQIGADVPVQVRDFAGNTVTQFYSTGIIVDVTPTLLADTVDDASGRYPLEFIHLDVQVEKSGSRPSAAGLVIDRSTANTQVLLLDGEQTVVGGLYSTEESVSRRGIPLLKDLPWWFFGLRYVFGNDQRTVSQKELLIVLQAEVRDPLLVRAQRPIQDGTLERSRQGIESTLRRFSRSVSEEVPQPRRYREEDR